MKHLCPVLLAFLLSSATLPAAERVALVIGNDAYQNTVKLDNCVNDARAVSGMLKKAGFTVVAAENATAEQMHEKLAEFQKQAAGCKVGLFFYAGHEMEDEGKNYLVPVDAALERKAQVPIQTLGLAQVMDKMKEAKIPAKILLLDCCRNMPPGRGWRATRGGGGMAAVDGAALPESNLVYFATAPGTEALDVGASGKHSPFTDGLLQKLKVPGIHAIEALMQVEDVVHQQTSGRQRPKLFSDGETAAFREFSFAANRPSGVVAPQVNLTQLPQLLSSGPVAATKEKRFENSLNMKFVPVPGTGVLFCIHETRASDYKRYCEETGAKITQVKTYYLDLDQPTYDQDDHPVIVVSKADCLDFCRWLSSKEKMRYRLPSDHEWSCAVGIGEHENPLLSPSEKDRVEKDTFPWGSAWPPPLDAGNYKANININRTTKVMSFRPNDFGIYDLGGNASEWCGDPFRADGSGNVIRGAGYWVETKEFCLSSDRVNPDKNRMFGWGFRCVLELPNAPVSKPSAQ